MSHPDPRDRDAASENDAPGLAISGLQSLDGFASESGCAEGVALNSLDVGTVLTVKTMNSRYTIVVVDSAHRRVVVTGGSYFPEKTDVRLDGATAGGSLLKIGWIGVGLRLEVLSGHRRVTTSPVRSITIEATRTRTLRCLTRFSVGKKSWRGWGILGWAGSEPFKR